MKTRKLGSSIMKVSEIGLGCMSLGTDEKKAADIIHAALEEGITYFDTADLYDYGMNEAIVGQTLKNCRDQVILATKVGNRWNEAQDGWSWDASSAYIKTAVKDSLTRLRTDYIDLYQLHGGTMEDNIDEVIDTFEDLKKAGYIRAYGISSIRPNVIKQYAAKSHIDSVMMQYSLLDRRPEEWLPLLQEQNISIIARGPVAKGLLSERMLSKLNADGYLDYSYNELKELLPLLKDKLSPQKMNKTALQYVLAEPTVAAVIPGASSVAQLRENCEAVRSKALSSEELQLLRQLTKANVYHIHRD
ncbi:aldo/keto reductase [Peribacillus sp. Hz7]|uniref:aldo/keto reductase n=1 Tax=Peribacillus sp. Hz7 TaxID=3344873 RepID=UPI0035C9AEEA